MKQQLILLLPLVFLLFACGVDSTGLPTTSLETPSAEAARPTSTVQPPPSAEPASPTPPTPTAQATLTADPASPTPPTLVAPDPEPHFHGLHFTGPGEANPQTSFPAGIEEIFAVWFYENMRPEDVMKRTWLKDGQVWLEREEAWDSDTLGTEGMISAVSIYDFEDGLDPGSYLLQLKINGQIQQEAAFDIPAPDEAGVVTLALSSETRLAKVIDGNRLVVEDMDGAHRREVALVDEEIVDLRWFSDGRHLLFVEVDRSEQVGGSTIGVKHALWLVDTDTGTLSQLSTFEENLHSPLIPFGSGYIAIFKGSSYGDACFVDRQLRIMELDENFQRAGLYGRSDFLGAPLSEAYWLYPVGKLSWIDNASQLQVSFDVTCWDANNPEDGGHQLRGEYILDLVDFMAERVADIPLPE
jgi:hypothetical protein